MLNRSTLDNGLTIITQKDDNAKTATISYLVKSGSYNETEETLGIAHFTEHMLFKGTTSLTSKDINYAIEGIGGILNALTSFEYTKYHCTVPSEYWKTGIEILSDMVWNNTIPEKEFVLEKQVVLEELKMYKDVADIRAIDLLFTNLHRNYKLRQTVGGEISTVKAITREQMLEYIDKYYVPNNITIVGTGNINHEDIVEFAKNYIDYDINNNDNIELEKFKPDEIKPEENEIIEEKEIEQSHLCWGMFVPEPASDEYAVMDIIATLLGGNASSRLYQIVREEKGLAYSVNAWLEELRDNSILMGYVGLDKQNIDLVKNIIFEQINKIKTELIDNEELERVKSYIKGTTLISLETTSSKNSYICSATAVNVEPNIEDYFEKLNKITSEEVMQIANKYLKENNICFSQIISKN